ncbi:SAM-dependent methyltransferase [Micromonospora echinofusca]|uniref:Methyltransferase domain-containing protein n=1 Tax=Micromonospora echinofusca TaxID=47858 RepID=A0ABS3VP08_MICEH|nr:class I SAM-dependent methyltransferase [Micromonospora echinofusca]MBO4206264.1 methyltransferase domain-containing protein [Micromonospora echinofusca]
MSIGTDVTNVVVRTSYEQDLNEHWETKQSDPINLLLGEMDGLYHHHYAAGDFNRNVLTAPEPERERLILKEMHRLETEQVGLILDPLAALTPQSRVLDAGSGRGGTSFMIHDRYGCRVDGVNFCKHHIAFAEQLAEQRRCADKVNFHYANMAQTPFEDASFDAVVSNETTMYVDLSEAFREFARLLRPGGRYVLVTWCQNDAVADDSPEVRQIDEHYVCHIHKRSTYLRALAENGLVPALVQDLTAEAIPYWELRSNSRLKTGVEDPFLAGYRSNSLNYLVIAADRVVEPGR